MNFLSYVDRQRRAVRAEQIDRAAVACESRAVPGDIIADDSAAAKYFERLSSKLFEELDAMRGFRREEEAVCC